MVTVLAQHGVSLCSSRRPQIFDPSASDSQAASLTNARPIPGLEKSVFNNEKLIVTDKECNHKTI